MVSRPKSESDLNMKKMRGNNEWRRYFRCRYYRTPRRRGRLRGARHAVIMTVGRDPVGPLEGYLREGRQLAGVEHAVRVEGADFLVRRALVQQVVPIRADDSQACVRGAGELEILEFQRSDTFAGAPEHAGSLAKKADGTIAGR